MSMIYFDESGNSGDNLLDNSQPTYLLLSHDFTEDEAKDILHPLLRVSKAKELHFKKIRKYPSQKRALIDCLNNELIQSDKIFFYASDKQFMIVVHIVDKLIETVLYEHDIDIYQGGLNLSTANILYIMGTNVWDKTLFSEMCTRFVKWVRTPVVENRKHFYDSVKNLYKTLNNEKDKALLSMVVHSELYSVEIEESFGVYSMDATLSCFVAHCDHWAKQYGKPFDVTVDDSKQLEYWNAMIKFLANELPTAEVGYGSRKHRYPLLINSLQSVSSDNNISIQLADILASSLNLIFSSYKNGLDDELVIRINQTRLKYVNGNSMWPSRAVTPEELDMLDPSGQNPLDFIAEVANNKPLEYAKAYKRK